MTENIETTIGFDRAVSAVRSSMISAAVAGIILGVILLFWPGISLLTLATLFGIAVIVAGIYRIVFGAAVDGSAGLRWLMVIFGLLTVAAGVLCLIRPVATLVFLAIMIGIAWIFQGIHDVVAGIAGTTSGSRWLAVIGGIISAIAGVIVMILPITALGTFAVVGGIMLIVVSIVTLATLPAKPPKA